MPVAVFLQYVLIVGFLKCIACRVRMSWTFVFALALALSATGAWADWYSDCNQAKDLDLRISGCTTIIERGKRESLEDRSFAYTNRGDAYVRKGDVDRAIADYDKASEKYRSRSPSGTARAHAAPGSGSVSNSAAGCSM